MQRRAFFSSCSYLCLRFAPEMPKSSSSRHSSSQSPPASALTLSASNSAQRQVSPEVTAAEAALAASDWKTAEAKLDPWLAASHSTDARALFDAGYVADAEDSPDDAAALYRRAVGADPNSIEATLSLGLLLAKAGQDSGCAPAARPRHRA